MGPRGNPRQENPTPPVVLDQKLSDLREEEAGERQRKAHAVVFLIDASASMEVSDARVGGSRFDQAKELVDEVISGLDGQSVAIYAFTSELTTVVPLTTDYLFARLMTRELRTNEGDVAGTDLLKALDGVRIKHLDLTEIMKTVVVLSDGGDTQLEGLAGEERAKAIRAILSRIGDRPRPHLQLFTVGLGTPQGDVVPGVEYEGKPIRSSLDEPLLRLLAERGGGQYYFANAYSTFAIATELRRRIEAADEFVTEIGGRLLKGKLEETVEKSIETTYDEYHRYPLALAILCLCMALALPETRK